MIEPPLRLFTAVAVAVCLSCFCVAMSAGEVLRMGTVVGHGSDRYVVHKPLDWWPISSSSRLTTQLVQVTTTQTGLFDRTRRARLSQDWKIDTKTQLGSGGFGVVYLATKLTKPNKGKKYAVKYTAYTVKNKAESNTHKLVYAKCPHYVVKPEDMWIAKGEIAMVMELASCNLGKWSTGHCVDQSTAKSIASIAGDASKLLPVWKQMIEAVICLNDNGFAHRDIKSSNFLLLPNGKVVLADFGEIDMQSSISKERPHATREYNPPKAWDWNAKPGPDFFAIKTAPSWSERLSFDAYATGLTLIETYFGSYIQDLVAQVTSSSLSSNRHDVSLYFRNVNFPAFIAKCTTKSKLQKMPKDIQDLLENLVVKQKPLKQISFVKPPFQAKKAPIFRDSVFVPRNHFGRGSNSADRVGVIIGDSFSGEHERKRDVRSDGQNNKGGSSGNSEKKAGEKSASTDRIVFTDKPASTDHIVVNSGGNAPKPSSTADHIVLNFDGNSQKSASTDRIEFHTDGGMETYANGIKKKS